MGSELLVLSGFVCFLTLIFLTQIKILIIVKKIKTLPDNSFTPSFSGKVVETPNGTFHVESKRAPTYNDDETLYDRERNK